MLRPSQTQLAKGEPGVCVWVQCGSIRVCVCVCFEVTLRLVDQSPSRQTSGRPWAIWKYDCNPCEDLAWVSITSVICHTGIQYSFHVQVKLLSLSASPIIMGDWGGGKGRWAGWNPVKGAGMTGERVSEIERAPLQSNPWVGIKKSIVEHKVSLMQQGEL